MRDRRRELGELIGLVPVFRWRTHPAATPKTDSRWLMRHGRIWRGATYGRRRTGRGVAAQRYGEPTLASAIGYYRRAGARPVRPRAATVTWPDHQKATQTRSQKQQKLDRPVSYDR